MKGSALTGTSGRSYRGFVIVNRLSMFIEDGKTRFLDGLLFFGTKGKAGALIEPRRGIEKRFSHAVVCDVFERELARGAGQAIGGGDKEGEAQAAASLLPSAGTNRGVTCWIPKKHTPFSLSFFFLYYNNTAPTVKGFSFSAARGQY